VCEECRPRISRRYERHDLQPANRTGGTQHMKGLSAKSHQLRGARLLLVGAVLILVSILSAAGIGLQPWWGLLVFGAGLTCCCIGMLILGTDKSSERRR